MSIMNYEYIDGIDLCTYLFKYCKRNVYYNEIWKRIYTVGCKATYTLTVQYFIHTYKAEFANKT